MTTLFTDMSSLRLAPTLGREALATAVSFLAVLVAALVFLDSTALQVGVPLAFAVYGLVRIALAGRRGGADGHRRRG